METKSPAKVFIVEYQCDNCKSGNLKVDSSGVALMIYPPRYPHTCDNCGYQECIRGVSYPYTIFVKEETK